MNFAFTEDQLALKEGMASFFAAEIPAERLRRLIEKNEGRSPELRAKIAEQGLFGLSIPEDAGGLGLTDIDWALMTPELGYYAIPDFVAETACVSSGLLAAAGGQEALLGEMAAGEKTVAIAHPINPLVGDGHLADFVLMNAGGAVHLVPKAQVQCSPVHESIDASRQLVACSFTASAATQIADAAQGLALWDTALNRAAVTCAGQMIGLAQRMVDMSVAYTNERKQFGKALASFQAVKHHMAEVIVKIEFAKPVLYRAAYALAHGEQDAALLASHAKLACGEAAWLAARKGIQVHGGMGYTWEVDLQMFMKRAWALNSIWGDNAFHRQHVGEKLMAAGAPVGPGTSF